MASAEVHRAEAAWWAKEAAESGPRAREFRAHCRRSRSAALTGARHHERAALEGRAINTEPRRTAPFSHERGGGWTEDATETARRVLGAEFVAHAQQLLEAL
jgi:hypothetical protein